MWLVTAFTEGPIKGSCQKAINGVDVATAFTESLINIKGFLRVDIATHWIYSRFVMMYCS